MEVTELKHKKEEKDKEVIDPILCYGQSIIESPIFQSGYNQTHHLKMTVSDHAMDVTIMSVTYARLLKKLHIKINEKDLVQGALCHDLGILGRDEKFENNRECCKMHPVLSVEEAKKLIPDLDQKTSDVIRRHMWPATAFKLPPNSKEAFLVSLADKYSAIREFISIWVGPQFKARQRQDVGEALAEAS